MSWYPCCCGSGSPCNICTGTVPSLQVTITGFSQTNTPPILTSPPCACTTLNQTMALGGGSCSAAANVCVGNLGTSFWFSSATYDCFFGATQQGLAMFVDVHFYANGSGGLNCFSEVTLNERDDDDSLVYSRSYYGTTTVDAGSETIDCTTLDFTFSLSSVCDISGSSDVWCGGSISLQVEAI